MSPMFTSYHYVSMPGSRCYELESHGTIHRPRHVYSKRQLLLQRDGNLGGVNFSQKELSVGISVQSDFF